MKLLLYTQKTKKVNRKSPFLVRNTTESPFTSAVRMDVISSICHISYATFNSSLSKT